jgi:hypothetical protein
MIQQQAVAETNGIPTVSTAAATTDASGAGGRATTSCTTGSEITPQKGSQALIQPGAVDTHYPCCHTCRQLDGVPCTSCPRRQCADCPTVECLDDDEIDATADAAFICSKVCALTLS